MLDTFPMRDILRGMAVSLDGAGASDVDIVVGLRFTDTGEDWTLHVRHGVAVTTQLRPDRADARLETRSIVWKEMLIGIRNPAFALAGSEVHIEGSRATLLRCLLLFRPSD
jgi:alkyl sulfatase BDS1-like metallo-beta-lactamase superfamily hydrolase